MLSFHSVREFRRQTEGMLDLKNFYPERCVFHWDGKGQIPVASQMLKVIHNSIADVCAGCRETNCTIRQAPYQPKQ
jgi:hypothetical protein